MENGMLQGVDLMTETLGRPVEGGEQSALYEAQESVKSGVVFEAGVPVSAVTAVEAGVV